MHRFNRTAFSNITQMSLDVLTLVVSYVIAYVVVIGLKGFVSFPVYFNMAFLYASFVFLIMVARDMYNRGNFRYYDRILKDIVFACLLSSIVSYVILSGFTSAEHTMMFLGVFILVTTVLLCAQWLTTSALIMKSMKKSLSRAIMVGDPEQIEKYLYYQSKTSFRISPIGYVANDCDIRHESIPCLGTIDELEAIISTNVVDEVIFALPHSHVGDVERSMQICEERGLTVKVALEFNSLSFSKSGIVAVGPMPVLIYHTVSLNEFQHLLKRVLDISGSIVGLLITLLLSIVIVPAIKIDSEGPVLFSQVRMGRNGRKFRFYKFRSMCTDAERLKSSLQDNNQVKDGMMFKIKEDPRVTRVGAFLRRTSLDELPQFINVLRGEMSLVGTRPPTMDEVEKYEHSHFRRISIKPGITGLWQISGRSEITDFNEVVALDTEYIDNWSVWKDISIVLRTVGMIIKRKQNAY